MKHISRLFLCVMLLSEALFAQYVTLSWTQSVGPGVVSNNIYRSTVSGGPYTEIYESTTPITSYVDNAVSPGTTYYYVVTAVTPSGGAGGLDGLMTSGSAVLTAASTCPFTSEMVGSEIYVQQAGGASGTPALLTTTVASYQNACKVTLAANATNGTSSTNTTSSATLAMDGAMTGGSAILTSASTCPFTSAMVGYPVYIGAPSGSLSQYFTVLSFQNSCQITMSTTASSTVSGQTILLLGLQFSVQNGPGYESGYSNEASASIPGISPPHSLTVLGIGN